MNIVRLLILLAVLVVGLIIGALNSQPIIISLGFTQINSTTGVAGLTLGGEYSASDYDEAATGASDKGSAGDAQAIVLNRVEGAQAGVGAVARDQNHLDALLLEGAVQRQEFFHQGKGIAGGEYLVLMLDLVLAIGLDALAFINLVAVAQVEQRPRGNRQHQFVA